MGSDPSTGEWGEGRIMQRERDRKRRRQKEGMREWGHEGRERKKASIFKSFFQIERGREREREREEVDGRIDTISNINHRHYYPTKMFLKLIEAFFLFFFFFFLFLLLSCTSCSCFCFCCCCCFCCCYCCFFFFFFLFMLL